MTAPQKTAKGRTVAEIRATGAAWVAESELEALCDAAEAAERYLGHTGEHYWRCEYRTAAKGWKKGDPPIIECICGLDALDAALVSLGYGAVAV